MQQRSHREAGGRSAARRSDRDGIPVLQVRLSTNTALTAFSLLRGVFAAPVLSVAIGTTPKVWRIYLRRSAGTRGETAGILDF